MRGRRERLIHRMKVPNLAKNGMKFDLKPKQQISFFSKISNSLKLLEEATSTFALTKKQNQKPRAFKLQSSFTLPIGGTTENTKKKMRSDSLPNMFELLPTALKENKKSQKSILNETKLQRPFSQNEKKRTPYFSLKKNQRNKGQNEISGTCVAPMPLENILAERERLEDEQSKISVQNFFEKLEKKRVSLATESDEEVKNEEEKEDLSAEKDNLEKWAGKISGDSHEVYSQFERVLLEKTKLYKSRQLKLQHKSEWR